ncbi:uncharacterized protein L969DRAFT_93351 [Mixia osmundae IAM 14324]|uniref:DNA polymerase n=1 Tax=Mixia osmundae (strain CBS 9802 / IAM 14324 / JCM 22182 / KY 12970) TaxID=764103 RepID=G7E5B9_MIXOS|nr:uncharacterized protein L969DRAFT_93351 [Mixia osmundae IAM 14324]KEI40821.1 hypothetical protein L969DRAFT_93351 [Mixia osmundae IAM 14324]GAA98029.1 hypothetical protein E5Q_04709 [Mixia osmundae IAM 14324]
MTTNSPGPSAPSSECFIRVRLNNIDTVQTPIKQLPRETSFNPDNARTSGIPFITRSTPFLSGGQELDKVPEIRVFGSTDQGQRCCVHVHGVFPYVFIQYSGELDPEIVNSYIRQLGRTLNAAMAKSFKREQDRKVQEQYVGFICLVKGVPFYGFHIGQQYFLKIYCLQPRHMTRLSAILRSGKIMSKPADKASGAKSQGFEVFEAHIPFLLQFMLDHNLYGCDWIDLERCKFRGELPIINIDSQASAKSGDSHVSNRIYCEGSVPEEALYPVDNSPAKICYSQLEIDVHACDIINRRRVEPRLLHADFRELLEAPYAESQKLVHSVKELWKEEALRRKERGEDGPEDIASYAGGGRLFARGEQPHWAAEDGWRRAIFKMIEQDKVKPASFESFVKKPSHFDGLILTAFESVTALFPTRLRQDQLTNNPFGVWAPKGVGVENRREQSTAPSRSTLRGRSRSVSVLPDDFDDVNWSDTEGDFNHVEAREHSDPDVLTDDGAMPDEAEEDPLPPDEYGSPRRFHKARAEDVMMEDAAAETRHALDDEDNATPPPRSSQTQGSSASPSPTKNGLRATLHKNGYLDVSPISLHKKALRDAAQAKLSQGDGTPAQVMSQSAYFRNKTPSPHKSKTNAFGGAAPMISSDNLKHAFQSEARKPTMPGEILPWNVKPRGQLGRYFERVDRPRVEATTVPEVAEEVDLLNVEQVRTVHDPSPQTSSVTSSDSAAMPPPQQSSGPVHTSTSESDNGSPDYLMPSPTPTARPLGASTPTPETNPSLTDSAVSEHFPALPASPRATKRVKFSSPSVSSAEQSVSTRAKSITPTSAPALTHNSLQYAESAPTTEDLRLSLQSHNMKDKDWGLPFFSVISDVPESTKEYAGRRFHVGGITRRYLKDFHHSYSRDKRGSRQHQVLRWEYGLAPPSKSDCLQSLRDASPSLQDARKARRLASQVEGPTQANRFGFRFQQIKSTEGVDRGKQHMDCLSIELHVNTRERMRVSAKENGKAMKPVDEAEKLADEVIEDPKTPQDPDHDTLRPDPEHDSIEALCYCLQTEDPSILRNGRLPSTHIGMIVVEQAGIDFHRLGFGDVVIDVVEDEGALIDLFIDKVQHWDPEILAGFEVHKSSWGYLVDRGNVAHGLDLVKIFGRVDTQSTGRNRGKEDAWGYNHTSSLRFTGRHVLCIWRILRGELALTQYTLENLTFHVLQERTPHYTHRTLTRWYTDDSPAHTARVLQYWLRRASIDIELLDEAEIISRNAEFARVFGVDFMSVLTRGSQFKVESFMFRVAKPESFLLLSPDRVQVGKQNAAECQPLIMEPQSAFYTDPVLVLDFQSLYPSCMIAYNYCYSTCLGRAGLFKNTTKFGTTTLDHPAGLLSLLQDELIVSPNGFVFVKPHVRKSLLSKMLSEILDTRFMIKKSMKLVKDDKALTKMMNARQLGLKFIANVTYGYCSATFSGRMPCVEIADAIVQTGRETLERAMSTIHANAAWGARVVYGDTDSLFVHLPGKTKDDAFRIGREIAATITYQNPRPVELKFEKVYLPCVLQAKKRYVGFKYENEEDEEPVFDAKGIETVRRDGIPAQAKMVESSLKILFRTHDLSQVKEYCCRQWQRLLDGRVSIQDFTFAKEVKLGSYSDKGIPPPGPVVAAVKMRKDHRNEPQYAERVPYVMPISDGRTQSHRALAPEAFLSGRRKRLDAEYYITRMFVPALARIFNLVGVDVNAWYTSMPKTLRLSTKTDQAKGKQTMEEHFVSDRCPICRRPGHRNGVCAACRADPSKTTFEVLSRAHHAEKRQVELRQFCGSCASLPQAEVIECDSLDCPTYYARLRSEWQAQDIHELGLMKTLQS